MSRKLRLDLHILTKGLVSSRQKAQQLIRAGKVRDLQGCLLDKPGLEVSNDLEVQIKEAPRFVSRGGEKLLYAIQNFPVEVRGRVCIDGGISTGGFTDCLFQHGAARVYGIDVGYGQIAWALRNDPRLVLRERTNLRKLTPELLYSDEDPIPTLAVADLSFISLRLVLPVLKSLMKSESREAVLLVKPQFEVGKGMVGKGGIVRDPSAHVVALRSVISAAFESDWFPKGLLPSPITGAAGNHEYLLWVVGDIGNKEVLPDLKTFVAKALA